MPGRMDNGGAAVPAVDAEILQAVVSTVVQSLVMLPQQQAQLDRIENKLDTLIDLLKKSGALPHDNVQQAAERRGVSPASIRSWAAAGLIPGAHRQGRSWRIPVTSVVQTDDAEIARLAAEARK